MDPRDAMETVRVAGRCVGDRRTEDVRCGHSGFSACSVRVGNGAILRARATISSGASVRGCTSKTAAVVSRLAVTTRWPSGLNAAHSTESRCFSYDSSNSPLAAS